MNCRPGTTRGLAGLALVAGLAGGAALAAAESGPRLVLQAPGELEGAAREIESIPAASWRSLLDLVGLPEFGGEIVVVLAPEGSAEARRAAPWISGYADGGRDLVVLMPARAGRYPDPGLLPLLRHEVTHVLVARAAGGRPVPRWFDEGLAMAAARPWDLGDRARVALAVLTGDRLPLARIDAAFAGGEADVQAAYALAGDLVQRLIEGYGRRAPAAILRGLANGTSFEDAFLAATGKRLNDFESDYWDQRTLWDRWIPVVSSSVLLWAVAALLAIAAFRRRRQRDAELRRRWDEEERGAADVDGPRLTG